ncbi:hypothetical protein V8G69_16125 [Gaetbulibacter sp. M235]
MTNGRELIITIPKDYQNLIDFVAEASYLSVYDQEKKQFGALEFMEGNFFGKVANKV